MKRTSVILLVLVAALVSTSAALAHLPSTVTVTIRHQTRGCHTWSANGGPYKASLQLDAAVGSTFVVRDNDVMPHRLVQVAGPRVAFVKPAMSHMGATARFVLAKPGVYVIETRAGEDYMAGMKTVGPDNLLRLRIVVTR